MSRPLDLPTLLLRLYEMAGGRPLYLVGGSVRDLLLNRPVKDVDVVLPGPVEAFGRRAAKALGGSFFYLRQAEDTARIVLKGEEAGAPVGGLSVSQVDLVALYGGGITEDLRRRDFTVNSMALDISRGLPPPGGEEFRRALVDPLGGREDLQNGCIRRCAQESLSEDPLRCLRAVRFAAGFGWEIEGATREQVRETGPQLARVSAERIRDELFQILQLPPDASMEALDMLAGLDLLKPALRGPVDPEGRERVRRLHEKFNTLGTGGALDVDRRFQDYLEGSITPPRTRFALVKLNALLGPSAEGTEREDRREHARETEAVRSRLELSAPEAQFLRKTWTAASELQEFSPGGDPPPVRVHRLFRRYGDAVPAALLLARAKAGDRVSDSTASAWLRAWFVDRSRYLPEPLLNGHDLMRGFKREGGPWVAELLDSLQEAQVMGAVTNEPEAWEFVRRRTREG